LVRLFSPLYFSSLLLFCFSVLFTSNFPFYFVLQDLNLGFILK
jgi:hypothetical protein